MVSTAPATLHRTLGCILFMLVALPCWMVIPSEMVGHPELPRFVIYREAKHASYLVLAWVLIPALWWTTLRTIPTSVVFDLLRRMPMRALVALVGLATLSASWAIVPEYAVYELIQYWTLLAVLISVLAWMRMDERVRTVVIAGLVASMGVATAVGLSQYISDDAARFLPTVRRMTSADHTSLMGQKNATALSVLAQIFVVFAVYVRARLNRQWALSVGAGLLLVLECWYIASLQSRSALMGLAVGVGVLLLTAVARAFLRRKLMVGIAAVLGTIMVGTMLVFGALSTMSSGSWDDYYAKVRWRAAAELIQQPSRYWSTDRGTYTANSIHMASQNIAGVGVGNWGVAYPVYRKHNRDAGFSLQSQVRRAHNDHAQWLGELGYAGLLLWLTLNVTLVLRQFQLYQRTNDVFRLGLGAQLIALNAAMCTDFFIEIPYNKLQYFMVAVLAIGDDATGTLQAADNRPWVRIGALATALVLIPTALMGLRKNLHSVSMHSVYAELTSQLQADASTAAKGRAVREARERFDDLWARYEGLPGHAKTYHRDHLLMSHVLQLSGETQAAIDRCGSALALSPYHPQINATMAHLAKYSGDTDASARYEAQTHYILNDATDGPNGTP